jgi:hypothetical protein
MAILLAVSPIPEAYLALFPSSSSAGSLEINKYHNTE